MLFNESNSTLIVDNPFSNSLNLDVEIGLIDNHKLRIYLEHDRRSLFEYFLPQIKVIILIIEDIEWKHLDIDDAILTY